MTSLDWLGWIASALVLVVSVGAALHALLNKRDPRSGLGWVYVCLSFPGLGALVYSVLGVNRIRTLGQRLMSPDPEPAPVAALPADVPPEIVEIAKISNAVSRRPLLPGNGVRPLHNGEQAYPEMIAAIDGATRTIELATYLFDTDAAGREFIDALGRAAVRGVEVRVLLDGLGEWYSQPRAGVLLERRGIRVARFLRPSLRYRLHINLRNHRKLLVVDRELGFTGGMNIGSRHRPTEPGNRNRTVDVHFAVTGPVVGQLSAAFWEDWSFTTSEPAPLHPAAPPSSRTDGAWCRGISDGPNEDFDKLTWILIGALTTARHRIRIMTPYFVPTRELITALNNAALRGVEVDVLLPGKSNLRFVDWASRAMLWEMQKHGVRFWAQPSPFVHSKLLLVDDHYTLVGSANLDPRSLKLNFEFNLEVFDAALVQELDRHFATARASAGLITQAELDAAGLPIRLRNATARLFAPYL